jgi:hypothetical protein
VRAAAYKPLNPFFTRRIARSKLKRKVLCRVGGWPHFTTFHDLLAAGVVAATPLAVERLGRVADAVQFPRREMFLDEVSS